eukprot:361064-Chlamydomonas_euryale.AAC.8
MLQDGARNAAQCMHTRPYACGVQTENAIADFAQAPYQKQRVWGSPWPTASWQRGRRVQLKGDRRECSHTDDAHPVPVAPPAGRLNALCALSCRHGSAPGA